MASGKPGAPGRRTPGEESVAAQLRYAAEAREGEIAVTVRCLRDRFGYRRLTEDARREIGAALAREGLRLVPPLPSASLDDELRLILDVGSPRVAHWWKRTVHRGVKTWQVLAAILGLAGVATGLYSFADDQLREPAPLRPLTGDLRVLVAQFRVVDADGQPTSSVQGITFARSLFDALAPRLRSATRSRAHREPIQVDIRGPNHVPAVTGDDGVARAISAAELARDNGANIVLYGDIGIGHDETRLRPELYVTPGFLAGGEELAGRYGLGAPIDAFGRIDVSPETRRSLREGLLDRAGVLTTLILGLNDLAAGEYRLAAGHFRTAAKAPGSSGEAIIYLFLGNAEIRLRHFDEAERAYRRALRLEPAYARARFGLAEVHFQTACGGGGSTDRTALQEAISEYGRVLRTRIQPDAFPMRVKTNLGIGKAYLCASPPNCDAAHSHFDAVVAEYRTGRSHLRDETAEAWGGLAVMLQLCREEAFPTPTKRSDEVARRYEQAAAVARLPARRAYYWSELGRIHGLVGDYQRADDAYRRAITLEPSPRIRSQYRAKRAALRDHPKQ